MAQPQSRPEPMIQRTYTVRFETPAFLGDAGQNGRWRTPPFKHLLREWWRVAWAEAKAYAIDVESMRRTEAILFGAAADGEGARSLVRMRLEHWNVGGMTTWGKDPRVRHPEVGRGGEGADVGAHLYLGYGPLIYDRTTRSTGLKKRAAIQAGEENTLRLAWPEGEGRLLERALALADAFATIGGRSRNGWGSVMLGAMTEVFTPPLRDWQACFDQEWAHAVGRDERGALIWQTVSAFDDWEAVMRELARIKISLRTHFRFTSGKGAPMPEERHWLAYPVTNHSVKLWGGNRRLPNTLRFKVHRDHAGRLRGVIFHMPHLPPAAFSPNRTTLVSIWRKVHEWLDGSDAVTRIDT